MDAVTGTTKETQNFAAVGRLEPSSQTQSQHDRELFRGFVGTGDDVLIGGLIVRSLSQQLLVRAIGPDLAAQGVTGGLQDPVLELHDSNGAILSSNNNWQSASNSSAISAAGLAPNDSRDAAILLTPGPGQFTAIVRGAGTTTGVALLEAYLLQ